MLAVLATRSEARRAWRAQLALRCTSSSSSAAEA